MAAGHSSNSTQVMAISGCLGAAKYMCMFRNKKFNPLNTKLSCWNFNLVNADQFSRE